MSLEAPPSPLALKQELISHGFLYGSTQNSETLLAYLPHDLEDIDLVRATGDHSSDLWSCAQRVLKLFPRPSTGSTPSADLITLNSIVRVGRVQMELIDLLTREHFIPDVTSAYRSPAYQALLFSAKYLDGTLFSPRGQYYSLPPSISDHCTPDGAIDVINSDILSLILSGLHNKLPCSIFRPYLGHRYVAQEPWHWRTCKFKTKRSHREDIYASARCHQPDLIRAVREYIDPLFIDRTVEAKNIPASHVFSYGFDASGASRCIGSQRSCIALSIADASITSGQWSHRVLSVPHGFTPLMDGKILYSDIGPCTFRAHGRFGQQPAYLTAFATITHSINTPDKVLRSLETKLAMEVGEEYVLEKSLTDEWLYVDSEQLLLPVTYGSPRAGHYRREEASTILCWRFDEWLMSASKDDLPPYYISDSTGIAKTQIDLAHYALLLLYLRERQSLSPELSRLANSLDGFYRNRLDRFQVDNEESADSQAELVGLIFFIRSRLCLDEDDASKLFDAIWPQFAKFLMAHRSLSDGRLFTGHLASLVRRLFERGRISIEIIEDFPTPPDVINWVNEGQLFSLAAAQVLGLHIAANLTPGLSSAEWLLTRIVATPSGIGHGEWGSFRGLETFHSAIPVEAIAELWPLLQLPESDKNVIIERCAEAVDFLSRCQFDEGVSSLLQPDATARIGAVPYSLVDKHVRIDYGIHAARAARFVEAHL